MRKKTQIKYRLRANQAIDSALTYAETRRLAKENDTNNVRYFLTALKQISLTLSALGYRAEGEALARIKTEIHNRVLGPEVLADNFRLLH